MSIWTWPGGVSPSACSPALPGAVKAAQRATSGPGPLARGARRGPATAKPGQAPAARTSMPVGREAGEQPGDGSELAASAQGGAELEKSMNLFVRARVVTTWRLPGVRAPEAGHAIRVTVEGNPVAVFRVGSHLLAVDARCTHVGGPLDRGAVNGTVVTCPLHGSRFDLETGQVRQGPATAPVRTYRASVEADALVLESA